MYRLVRRMLIGPLLAVCATSAVLAVDVTVANAATYAQVRGTVKLRSHPYATGPIVGTARNRTTVAIECQVYGQTIRGTVRRSNMWNRLSGNRYISHAYVNTKARIPICPPPAAPAVSAPLTTASNAAFLAAAAGPAQQSQREFGVPASVTLAQAILESGWGKSNLSYNDRNYFGMKCFNGATGGIAISCRTYQTTECTSAGVCYPTSATFRVYASATDSFRDHGKQLANLARYQTAFLYKHDPNRFVAEVHRGGYATDPLYTTKLVALMQKHNLYQYDLR